MGGGGGGSSEPSSVNLQPEPIVPPEFLSSFIGQGKYNIGIAGQSGCGKSSFLNEIFGSEVADTGSTETTLDPTSYDLPLEAPAGHFRRFIQQLPMLHRSCAEGKLHGVKVWDLPGAGTRLHPSGSYFRDKGLAYFDFVVVLIGDRVLQHDVEMLSMLIAGSVKCFACRPKLDVIVSTHLTKQRRTVSRTLQRQLSAKEQRDMAIDEIDFARCKMIEEVRETVPRFNGHLYMTVAESCMDDGNTQLFELVAQLAETQLAIDRMLLEVIKDRHVHDLRGHFTRDLCGDAGRVAYNWFRTKQRVVIPAVKHKQSSTNETIDSSVQPEDSASQQGWQLIHLPQGDTDNSIVTESASGISLRSAGGSSRSLGSWCPLGCARRSSVGRCFLPEHLIEMGSNTFMHCKDLRKGSRVKTVDGDQELEVVSIKQFQSDSLVKLSPSSATIQVSPDHRVIVPARFGAGSRDVKASCLRCGEKVLCKRGGDQVLTAVEVVPGKFDVLQILFKPDLPIAVFEQPGAILTKGSKWTPSRRAGMHRRSQGGVHIPSTEDGFEDH